MQKRLVSFTLLVLLCSGPASAAPKSEKIQSFEREKTQKLNFEPTQVESPDAVRGGDPKNPPLTSAEIETTKKEIKRIRVLIESGQQMLAETEGNQSARLKIISTLTLLEIEMRKLNEKLRGSSPASGKSAAGGDATAPADATTADNEAQTAQEQSNPQAPSDGAPAAIDTDNNTRRGE